jgi:hypothetical protein
LSDKTDLSGIRKNDAAKRKSETCDIEKESLFSQAGDSQVLDFIAPVLAGQRAVGHVWTSVPDKNYPSGIRWNDTAVLNPTSGGLLQPDVGLADLAGVSVDDIFAQAAKDCAALLSGASLLAPDVR